MKGNMNSERIMDRGVANYSEDKEMENLRIKKLLKKA